MTEKSSGKLRIVKKGDERFSPEDSPLTIQGVKDFDQSLNVYDEITWNMYGEKDVRPLITIGENRARAGLVVLPAVTRLQDFAKIRPRNERWINHGIASIYLESGNVDSANIYRTYPDVTYLIRVAKLKTGDVEKGHALSAAAEYAGVTFTQNTYRGELRKEKSESQRFYDLLDLSKAAHEMDIPGQSNHYLHEATELLGTLSGNPGQQRHRHSQLGVVNAEHGYLNEANQIAALLPDHSRREINQAVIGMFLRQGDFASAVSHAEAAKDEFLERETSIRTARAQAEAGVDNLRMIGRATAMVDALIKKRGFYGPAVTDIDLYSDIAIASIMGGNDVIVDDILTYLYSLSETIILRRGSEESARSYFAIAKAELALQEHTGRGQVDAAFAKALGWADNIADPKRKQEGFANVYAPNQDAVWAEITETFIRNGMFDEAHGVIDRFAARSPEKQATLLSVIALEEVKVGRK